MHPVQRKQQCSLQWLGRADHQSAVLGLHLDELALAVIELVAVLDGS